MSDKSKHIEEESVVNEFITSLKTVLLKYGENQIHIEKRLKNKNFELEEGLRRIDYLEQLMSLDYCNYEKTLNDTQTGKLHIWREFFTKYTLLNGKSITLYIKVRIMSKQNGAICLSFHPAEREPKRALKKI